MIQIPKGKPSEIIQAYIDWLSDRKDEQERNWETVTTEDGKIQDYLHELEFCEDPGQMVDVAERWHDSRIVRRIAKDRAKALKPIKDYMDDPSCKAHIKRLKRLITELQQVEQFLDSDRVYKPRSERSEDGLLTYEDAQNGIAEGDYAEINVEGMNVEYAADNDGTDSTDLD